MKKTLQLLLSASLIWSSSFAPHIAFSQEVPEVSDITAKYEKAFETATYSIREIPAILKDLEGYDRAAGQAISENVMKDIFGRYEAAFTLLTLIWKDSKLTDEQKFNTSKKLLGAIGELISTVARYHGQDKVDTQNLMKKIDEMTTLDHAKEVFKEFVFDVKTIFSFPKSAEFKNPADAQLLADPVANAAKLKESKKVRVWGPIQQNNRNELTLQMVDLMGQAGPDLYKNIQDGKFKEAALGMLGGDDKSILGKINRLREYRLTAQKFTAATYMGLAAFGFIAPLVDIVGPLTGQYNDNTLFVSSLAYLSFWTVAGLTKFALTSDKVVKALKKAMEGFKNPKSLVDGQTQVNADGKTVIVRKTLMQKLKEMGQNVVLMCRRAIGKK